MHNLLKKGGVLLCDEFAREHADEDHLRWFFEHERVS